MFSPATATAPARVMVIAEIGVNHDGSPARAVELVEAAAAAGADAVKLQLFDPRQLLSNQARLAAYQKAAGQEDASSDQVFAMLDGLKLALAAMAGVRAAARARGLRFVVTPFSVEDVPALAQLDVDAVKIASPDAVNGPLLQAAAALGKPMLISTGAAELDEVGPAANLVRERGGCLLQCVSSYPTPVEAASLGGIRALAERFAVPVGYSDHTPELHTGGLAVAAGACVLEKHLTYDPRAAGPDHAASLDPRQFARYVQLARQAAAMLGPLAKVVQPLEQDVRRVSRQSVCVVRDLVAGHVLRREDLTVKRPGTGIPAARLESLVGRRLRAAVSANDLLRESDLA